MVSNSLEFDSVTRSSEIAILESKSPQIYILKTSDKSITKVRDGNTVRVKISRCDCMNPGLGTSKNDKSPIWYLIDVIILLVFI